MSRQVVEFEEKVRAQLTTCLGIIDLENMVLDYVEVACKSCHRQDSILLMLKDMSCRFHPGVAAPAPWFRQPLGGQYLCMMWTCCQHIHPVSLDKISRKKFESYCEDIQKFQINANLAHGCQKREHSFAIGCTLCDHLEKVQKRHESSDFS